LRHHSALTRLFERQKALPHLCIGLGHFLASEIASSGELCAFAHWTAKWMKNTVKCR
jgi:hypothetical protein